MPLARAHAAPAASDHSVEALVAELGLEEARQRVDQRADWRRPRVRPGEESSNTKADVDVLPEGDALFAPIAGEEDMVAATIFHHHPEHRWWYFPDMTADEVLFIKLHDSDHRRTWRAPHTAFHDVSRPDATTRYSYEYRGFAFFSRRG
jgi:hypothetical protein